MTDREEQSNVDQAYLDDDTPPWSRSSGPEAAQPAEPEVGTSPLAKELEHDGTLGELSARHTFDRRQAEEDARRGSAKALFGDWDTLDEKGKADWIKGEQA